MVVPPKPEVIEVVKEVSSSDGGYIAAVVILVLIACGTSICAICICVCSKIRTKTEKKKVIDSPIIPADIERVPTPEPEEPSIKEVEDLVVADESQRQLK